MTRLIIEGVTGTGKSSTVRAMLQRRSVHLYAESETFGDFMDRFLADPESEGRGSTCRLERVLDCVEAAPAPCIVERFHLSYYAIDGDWLAYRMIDERAAALGFRMVLLDIPDALLAERCLYRSEYGRSDWQGLIDRYGSERAAMDALRVCQQRRRDILPQSAVAHLIVDTSQRSWDVYAEEIWAWAERSS